MIEVAQKSQDIINENIYAYDAVFVLGANVKRIGTKENASFVATDYHADSATEMGLAGGSMRIAAAVDLYLTKNARRFVFTGGVNPRAIRKYQTKEIPSEASIYSNQFLRLLFNLKKLYNRKFDGLENTDIILEDKSESTQKNIKEVFQIIHNLDFKRVAILTSGYHIERAELFYRDSLKNHPEITADFVFLSAEDIMKASHPGRFDRVIKQALDSPEGRRRRENETKAIQDFLANK